MDSTKDLLIKKAYAHPSLRQNILNKGMVFLYCDYAGFASLNQFGVACCTVHNRTISVTAKQLVMEQDRGSNYGELQAVVYSVKILSEVLLDHQPKAAVIYTDCSCFSRILAKDRFSHMYDEVARDELLTALANLHTLFPEVEVQIRYMSRHKENNHLHRLAHHAARQAAVYKAQH